MNPRTDEPIHRALQRSRDAQLRWAAEPLNQRVRLVRSIRHTLVDHMDQLTRITTDHLAVRPSDEQTLSAEILPLLSACRMIEKRGNALLRPRRLSSIFQPMWLTGIRSIEHRIPHGLVYILAPFNYPLLLAGTQMLQALFAGNAAWVKPSPKAVEPIRMLIDLMHQTGVDPDLLRCTDTDVQTAEQVIDQGVDLVVLTGSANTGRAVLERLSRTLTPAIMELSGNDAVILLKHADLDQASRAITFGLTINSGATCIGPRRVICHGPRMPDLVRRLTGKLESPPPMKVDPDALEATQAAVRQSVAMGAKLEFGGPSDHGTFRPWIVTGVTPEMPLARTDLFAPVISLMPCTDHTQAYVDLANDCPYALAVNIFGPKRQARAIARHLIAGSICINDLIVPTAHPDAAFGGARQSGFGVTRGRAGLLAMTRIQTHHERRFGPQPYLSDHTDLSEMLKAMAQCCHGRSTRLIFTGLKSLVNRTFGQSRSRRAGADDADPQRQQL